jgi:uncharacterized protein YaiL (DUF2058 family)
MSDSLRDQLLGLGFKPSPKPEKKPEKKPDRTPDAQARPRPHEARPGSGRPAAGGKPGDRHGGPQAGKPAGKPGGKAGAKPGQGGRPGGKPRTQEEIDLAKAYAIRAQREKEERIEAERLKQEEARKRREAKAKLAEFLKDKGLNDKDAEIARHFEYGGKIKRIYVNEAQLKQLNAGELGVVQLDGRYLLVTAADLAEAETIFAPAVALKVDPNASAEDDPYADPQYRVPDDLVW